jgi:class 3 adenylate cyclase/tetratricopeptide (TPR) repeat protein
MKCSNCATENPQENKFCRKCGKQLSLSCPQCGAKVLADDSFCGKCGQDLATANETEQALPESDGERKHVTVLFSDLSGYTAMSERLDPEEVKEITTSIFSQISKVIDKYEGFVEKFVGDAVMALFGVPKAHEDDPLRAIRAAREIHELVDSMSPEVEKTVDRPISMHTGINTGLVVTGEVDMAKGTHGVSGDTINLASRLSSLAEAGEILVGPDTYRQAEGHFTFEALEPATVKGKAEPIQVHKVISPKDKPIKLHRLSGIRADLIGRKMELVQLGEAVENLREGKGMIFSVYGDAGTGKSRLVEEFKATLDLEQIQWFEGHAYAYSQNIPYFPLIDLLNMVFQIEEADPPEKIRSRIESGIEQLIGEEEDVIPYVGGLYGLSYLEVKDVSPEFWKSRLQDATQRILTALAQRASSIFLLEDLHWSDPSFVELLRHTLLEIRQPAIVLCVYRPVFTLFTTHQSKSLANVYQEIRLQDLSSAEAQDMLESLLKTGDIPSDLRRFVQDKAEGNPFYLEELVNSLIESETLIRDNGSWKATKSITETDISSTIHGVISGRLDRLEKETKRILQEASVIGRAFFYEILKKVTELKQDIDRCLRGLEQLDLIRTRSLQPDVEYMFKHALTQEVVYNGLLKKERKEIHERIGLVMEQLFQDRLPEFYETLAFHFKEGHSVSKAINYLMMSGEKSLRRYALEEAHQYYKEAFDILTDKPEKSREEETLLIDLLIKWAYVYYYRGYFDELIDLLSEHEELAASLENKASLGMFYAWLGFAILLRFKVRDSYRYLCKALEVGEQIGDQKLVGYACTWLAWTGPTLGRLEESVAFGERAHEISKGIESDHYLYFKSLGGIAWASYLNGDGKRPILIGKDLLDFGRRHSNTRSMVIGHLSTALGHLATGNYPSAIESFQRGVQISADPFYREFVRANLGVAYLLNEQFQEAEDALGKASASSKKMGFYPSWGFLSDSLLGVVSITKGQLSQGLRMIAEGSHMIKAESKTYYCIFELTLGQVYLKIVQGAGPKSFSILVKNIGFLLKEVPFAYKRAEEHFNNTIEVAKEIGAKGILGQAFLDLGLLHKAKGKKEKAKECISTAIGYFEQCEADVFLKQAKEALSSLN